MIKLNTKYHGEIEVKPEEIISFEKGLPGFPEDINFTILPLSEDGFFHVLQATENEQLGFIIVNPFYFFKDYDFQLDNATIEELELASEKDVVVYTILTVQDPFEKTTANLQAPVILNSDKQKAKQVILNDEIYKTKHLIFHGQPQAIKG